MQICGITHATKALQQINFGFPLDTGLAEVQKKETCMTATHAVNPIGRTSHGRWGFSWLKVDSQPTPG